MARLGLKARYPKRFKVTADSNHNAAISPNSQNLQFEAKAPDQAWTTDIAYIWTLEGWLPLKGLPLAVFGGCHRFVSPAVGLLQATWGLRCVPLPYKWPLGAAYRSLACPIIRIGAAKLPAMATDNSWLS
jgi:hypothetical protein